MPEQRVGVIGLGSMGRGIGKNLVTKGFPLTVYDANLAAIEPLQLLGAEGAETPRAVAERSDVVITVLPNGPDVEAVALGPNGIAEGAKPGTIVMDCSTIDPAVSLAVNQRLRERGIRMADTAMGRGSGEADVLGARPFGTLANLELHAVALAQIADSFTVDRALMKEVLLPLVVLDEPESLVYSQRTNCSCHGALLELASHAAFARRWMIRKRAIDVRSHILCIGTIVVFAAEIGGAQTLGLSKL